MKRAMFPMHTACVLSLCALLAACGGSSSSSSSAGDSTGRAAAAANPKLEKLWETDTVIRTPESVLWDSARQVFYVSDIDGDGSAKDGNGFISLMNADGTVKVLHWADGLDAPKGLGSYDGKLYVADLDSLAVIDIKTAEIKTKVYIPGAVFLNDVAVDREGNVYVSDTRQGKVFRYADGKISVFLGSDEMKGANGLLVWKGQLWINASGGIYTYNFADKKISLFCKGVKDGDGLTAVDDSDLIASRWKGEIYYVRADGSSEKILDTRDAGLNTADLYYLKEKNLLAVPTFNGNKVIGYRLER